VEFRRRSRLVFDMSTVIGNSALFAKWYSSDAYDILRTGAHLVHNAN